MTNYLHITLDVTEDALFGDVEAPESYEVNEYTQAVCEALINEFPDVDIEVSGGNMYSESSDLDEDTERWQGTVSHVINTTWIKWLEGLEY